ncbi:MAG TPA: hypothetical protein VNT75_24985 [Symbiobacteriaceae bacterium]|nr:hypothetical protein [Symbiobacteriaceae bacterium]
MRNRPPATVRLCIGLALALALLWGAPAAASQPCVNSPDRGDVLLVGRVMAKPAPGVVLIEVERYYRGTGARYVLAENSHSFSLWHWGWPRKGERLALGLDRKFGLQMDSCYRFSGRPEALASYGPWTAPAGGWDLRSGRLLIWLLFVLAVLVLLWSGLSSIIRRRRTS